LKKYKCINYGNCKKADTKEVIEVNWGDDFICPECESNLQEVSSPLLPVLKLILIIAGIVVLGVGSFFLLATKPNPNPKNRVSSVCCR
jgi:hypothetical protein